MGHTFPVSVSGWTSSRSVTRPPGSGTELRLKHNSSDPSH
jgi:hypothetical protein